MNTQPHLLMRRAALTDLPALDLPAGMLLRPATLDDLPGLACLLAAAFTEMLWTPQSVHRALFADLTVKQTWVLEDPEKQALVATASVRLLPERYPNAGYLHWVGTHPLYRGRKLGKTISLAVLHAFQALGCTSAVLETQDFRLPAIRVYQGLGFVPEHTHESHMPRWRAILNPPLGARPLTQVAFLVKDIDTAKAAWATVLEVPVPEYRLTVPGRERNLTYLGLPTAAQAKLAFFNLGPVQIELIEPVEGLGPSVWHEAPEGIHHLAFRTTNMAATRDTLAALGIPLVFRGDAGEGQVAYFDAREPLGLYFEFAEAKRSAL